MSTEETHSIQQEEVDLVPPSDAFTYKDQVCEIIETLTLDTDARQNLTKQSILKNRFLSEVLHYETRRDSTKKYYNAFRFMVTTGSIVLPAIMSVGQMDPEKLPDNFDTLSYWTSFMISLVVTISNGFLQLFSLDKNYFEFALTSEQLKTEGWQFFQLAGKYEDYATHEEAYKPFSKSVENIKRKQVEKEFQGKGDVNKNKKDKKDKEDKEDGGNVSTPDPKMDMILGLLGQRQSHDGVASGVRDILTQPISSFDVERGGVISETPSASEKANIERELRDVMG
jgi:hypothetical protein|tara:strand:- start:4407 stop:5255 length:849 start_codon:yes stop_codon:yes gene_type:complete